MNELIEQESSGLPIISQPAQLLQIAIQQGADLDKLQQLMDLEERWNANEAKKAFVIAKAKFRGECPAIERTMNGHNNKYAGLADTLEQIKELMSKYGFSHEWKTGQEGSLISVECCLTHMRGHSECTKLNAPADTSGNKNSIQAIGSTISYLERYTLFAILGLSSKEMDDDGNGKQAVNGGVDPEVIREAAKKEALEWFVGYQETVRNCILSIVAVKNGIATNQFSVAAEAWFELDEETQKKLWVAPSRGGIFTTAERETMKSTEFKDAYYGAAA